MVFYAVNTLLLLIDCSGASVSVPLFWGGNISLSIPRCRILSLGVGNKVNKQILSQFHCSFNWYVDLHLCHRHVLAEVYVTIKNGD